MRHDDGYEDSNMHYCSCVIDNEGSPTTGYQGIYCQTPFVSCISGNNDQYRCLNGGICGNSLNQKCRCTKEFGGDYCQKFVGGCDENTSGYDCEKYRLQSNSDEDEESKRLSGTGIFLLAFGVAFAATAVVSISAFVIHHCDKRNKNFLKKDAKEKGTKMQVEDTEPVESKGEII